MIGVYEGRTFLDRMFLKDAEQTALEQLNGNTNRTGANSSTRGKDILLLECSFSAIKIMRAKLRTA